MRTLIVFLIALNVLFFVLSFFITPDSQYAHVDGVGKLTVINNINNNHNIDNIQACLTLGPLYTNDLAERITQSLSGVSIGTQILEKHGQKTIDYLVYVQPFKDAESAQKAINDLHKQRVPQAKLIQQGTHKNAIFVGTYRRHDLADRQAQYVKYLGYPVKLVKQHNTRRLYWVQITQRLPKKFGQTVIDQAAEQQLSIVQSSCPS